MIQVTLAYVRRTKELCRYEEEAPANERPLVGVLYVSKSRLGGTAPERIVVTIDTTGVAHATD